MEDEVKQEINVVLDMLKTVMAANNVHFAILVDKKDGNKSSIAFLDKAALENGKTLGISVSIDEMNR